MRIQLDLIVAFHAVMETGGVNAAARRLRLSRSVVSKRIMDLEAALGVDLFVRSTVQMTPTEAAQEYYARTAFLIQELEDAANDVRPDASGLSGTLRLAAPLSVSVSHLRDVYVGFAKRHPDLHLAIDLDDRVVDLAGGGYDVAIRIGRLPDSSLKARRLADSRQVLCGAPSYLEQHGEPRTLEELIQHRTIGYANTPTSQMWRFAPAAPDEPEQTVRVLPGFVSNNGETMRSAAIAGMGLVLLPEFLVSDALRDGRLRPILADTEPLHGGVYVVYPPGRGKSRKVRAFIDHLVEAFAGGPPWAMD